MIEILPMKDRQQEEELLRQVAGAGREARIIGLWESGKLLGFAAVEAQEKTLRILKLSISGLEETAFPDPEQTFFLDSLMRSAASFGEFYGAEKIVTTFPDPAGFFKNRGFETENGFASAPMSLIVHYE